MIKTLRKPYPIDNSVSYRLKHALIFGLFVFAFLFVFRPFNIGALGAKLLPAALGFGAATVIAMIIMNVIIPRIFKNFYSEEGWTLGKEIIQTLLNIMLIGAFNFLFFSFYVSASFSWTSFLWFQFSAFAVGIIPVTVYLVWKEKSIRTRYEKEADAITGEMNPRHGQSTPEQIITFETEGSRENFSIHPQKIFYIQSADNYLDIFYSNGMIKRTTIRSTLKSAQAVLQDHPSFLRCHRSYIINMDKVIRISGNAQGYKLHLKDTDETVPVARQYNDLIKNKLTNRP